MYNKVKTRINLKPAAIIFILAAVLMFRNVAASQVFGIKGVTLVSYNGKSSSVTVPKKIKKIGKSAFSGNKIIKKVTVKKGVVSIQGKAFKECTNLKNIKLPSTIKYISPNAFKGCKSITIYVPEGSYAAGFAKKHNICYKITENKNTGGNGNGDNSVVSDYNITGMECYWYTAGTFPCIAQKKTITSKENFNKLYDLLLLLNSGERLSEDDIMENGGQVLRVVIHFSNKEDLIIECNPVVYIQNGSIYKTSNEITPGTFWEQAEGEITETEL